MLCHLIGNLTYVSQRLPSTVKVTAPTGDRWLPVQLLTQVRQLNQ
jgi:hypothetical protein